MILDERNDLDRTSIMLFDVISSCGIVPIRAKKYRPQGLEGKLELEHQA